MGSRFYNYIVTQWVSKEARQWTYFWMSNVYDVFTSETLHPDAPKGLIERNGPKWKTMEK